ncbi:response regulator [Litoribacillus peritrichatus]|uniref:histidine kinase n=1 Tax=Litoribacillus peritrichatus TaxID=718191 RepID=A0ABP7N747_9GAMM
MRIPTRQRLSYRQARNTLIVAFLLGTIFSLSLITINYYRMQQAVEDQVQALSSITIDPASRIAYNIDIELAKELLKGLVQVPLIRQATIVEPSGNILASAYKEVPESQYTTIIEYLFSKSPQYAFKLSVSHDPTEELGELHLTINMHPTGENFINESLTLLGTVLIQACVLAIALLVMFYFMLTKPLSSITAQLSNIRASDSSTHRLAPLPQHKKDEIGLLIDTTNQQLSDIEQNFYELKLADEERKRYTDRLEQAVESRTKELTEANNELTHANVQLEEAKEEAVRTNQARAIFLANMSHEIRTPLSGVLGMINLALDSKPEKNIREQLELASASGDTLQQILNDILDIAKVESGKINLEATEFNLRDTIEQTAGLLKNSPQAENIDLFLNISPNFPESICGDPTRIKQIFTNILSNALKFTEEGYVAVVAEYNPKGFKPQNLGANAPIQNIRVRVIDTGIGMTEDEQERIFTPFTQASSKTTRKYGGTGLGLTLVKQLTECMSGSVSIESTKGAGSCFTLTFGLDVIKPANKDTFLANTPQVAVIQTNPVHEIESEALINQLVYWGATPKLIIEPDENILENDLIIALSHPVNTNHYPKERTLIITDKIASSEYQQIQRPVTLGQLTASVKSIANAHGNHQPTKVSQTTAPTSDSSRAEQILIVEDNEVNQKVARGLLKKLGFKNIHLAENGEIAVNLIKEFDIDLVLMDCHMPVMDGYDATKAIRQLPHGKDIPIIAVTANIMNEDRQRCFDCGMNDFLTKPYRKEDLTVKLDQWLEEQKLNS